MKKNWLARIMELETKSKILFAEELFEQWLSEHYPNQHLQYCDYINMMPLLPQEFRGICFDRFSTEMKKLQEDAKKVNRS